MPPIQFFLSDYEDLQREGREIAAVLHHSRKEMELERDASGRALAAFDDRFHRFSGNRN